MARRGGAGAAWRSREARLGDDAVEQLATGEELHHEEERRGRVVDLVQLDAAERRTGVMTRIARTRESENCSIRVQLVRSRPCERAEKKWGVRVRKRTHWGGPPW